MYYVHCVDCKKFDILCPICSSYLFLKENYVIKFPSSLLHLLLCLCFAPGQLLFPACIFFFFFSFSTDSNPDRSTDSQGGPSGLPQAMARAHPHSARVCEGSGWPAAAQSAVNLLSCHQNSSIQTTGAGQAAFSGCKSTILAGPVLIQNSITTFLFSIASYSYS